MKLIKLTTKKYLYTLLVTLAIFIPAFLFLFLNFTQPCSNYTFTFGTENIESYVDSTKNMYGYIRTSNMKDSDTVYMSKDTHEMVQINRENNTHFSFSITNCKFDGKIYYDNFEWK